MSRSGEPRRDVPDSDTSRGVSSAFQTIYEPERAAIQQFDNLIEKLSAEPGKRRGKVQ